MSGFYAGNGGGKTMNRALLVILIPAVLVAVGYILVFRFLGVAPGYLRLILAIAVFLAAAYWLWPERRRSGMKDRE
jgi:ABC-type spermidine/putrescine transport system permease subunit II